MDDRDRVLSRKARMVALVMAGAMVLWLLAQFLGGRLGLPPRYAFLADFAALAAFVWALYVTFQIWQARRNG
jgi:hypothetical protein